MYKKVSLVVFCIVVLITIFFGLQQKWWQKDMVYALPPRPAPDVSLQDTGGVDVRLSSFRSHAVVINLWATWCPFCLKELVTMAAVQKEFGERVVFIAVNRAESLEKITKYMRDAHFEGSFLLLQDPTDSLYQSLGGFSMPETVFLDREGLLRDHKRGPMSLEEMRRRVEKML